MTIRPNDLTRRGPGKFTFEVDAVAYGLALCGVDDEYDYGECDGWAGVLRGFQVDPPLGDLSAEMVADLSETDVAFLREHPAGCIISESNDGLVDVLWFSDAAEREAQWLNMSPEVES